MKTKEIVEYMISILKDKNKKNCLLLAFDRGRGEGKQIENWILAEMNVKLIELKKKENFYSVEGEHKYEGKPPNKKRYEHCDLWWRKNKEEQEEYWLEVKTIVFCRDKRRGNLNQISNDLEKKNQIKKDKPHIFHHLTIAFIDELIKEKEWETRLNEIYEKSKLIKEDILRDYQIDEGKKLSIFLGLGSSS